MRVNRLLTLVRSGPYPPPTPFILWQALQRALAYICWPRSVDPWRPCSPLRNCSMKSSDQRGSAVSLAKTALGASGYLLAYQFCQAAIGVSLASAVRVACEVDSVSVLSDPWGSDTVTSAFVTSGSWGFASSKLVVLVAVQYSKSFRTGLGSWPASTSLQPCRITCRTASGSSVAASIFSRQPHTSPTAKRSSTPIERTR